MQKIDLSVILACYNEEKIFSQSLTEIVRVLQELPVSSEIILVDDFSQDSTRDLIDQFMTDYQLNNPVLVKLFHEKNYGRGKTVTDGFQMARGEMVGYLDIDLEVPAYYIPEFVRALEDEYDAVIAHRVYSVPISQFHRWILSRGYSYLVRLLLNLPFSDTEAGFKFFQRKKILPLLEKIKDYHWFWDTEIMAYSSKVGLKIKEVPALFTKRSDKKSTVKIFKDSLYYLRKLLGFKKMLTVEQYWQEQPESFEGRYKEAKGFAKIVQLFLGRRQKKIERFLEIQTDQKFLDVGCGSGIILEQIIKMGGLAVGFDYSQKTLDLAQKRLSSYPVTSFELVLGDARHLPFENESFDGLIASGLLDYIKETKQVLSEFQRVLKTGGTLIVTAPKRASPFWFLRTSWGNFLRKKFLNLPPIIRWFSKQEMTRLLEEFGFTIEGVDSVFATMWIFKCRKVTKMKERR